MEDIIYILLLCKEDFISMDTGIQQKRYSHADVVEMP